MTLALDLSNLWAAPLADAALMRFEIAWANAIIGERTPAPGPDRKQAYWMLKSEAKVAWLRRDTKTLAGVGTVLHRARNLNDQGRRQVATALMAVRRFAEAREVLTAAPGVDADYWLNTARVLAGLGRLSEALRAVQTAAGRAEGPPAETDIVALIREQDRVACDLDLAMGWRETGREAYRLWKKGQTQAAAERLAQFRAGRPGQIAPVIEAAMATPADWPGLRDAAVAWLLIGRPDAVADLYLAAAPSALPHTPAETDEALRLAGPALADSAPEKIAELVRWAKILFREGAGRRLLDEASRVLAGQGDWSAVAAAASEAPERLQAFVATALGAAERPEAAIAIFSRLAETAGDDASPWLRELAWCSGLESTARIGLRPRQRVGSPRVFDVFPYDGEIEKLKIKLHEMAPWVERFVVVEAAETFDGRPRTIQLPAQQAEIAEFLPKILHVVVDRFPAYAASPAARAFHQRDQAVAALQDLCGPDDFVLVSDVDEVVDRRAVEGFSGLCTVLKKDVFRYFLNYRWAKADWADRGDLVMLRGRHLRSYSPGVARTLLSGILDPNRLEGAGWRFTAIGDAKAGEVRERLKAGEPEPGWELCAIEELPAYVQENRDRLAELIV